jgi:hypothetical protein
MTVHQDDTTLLKFTVRDETNTIVDLSGYTITLKIIRPDFTVLTKTPTKVSGGTTGQLTYQCVTGDLNKSGDYTLQIINGKTGEHFSSTVMSLPVAPNAEA